MISYRIQADCIARVDCKMLIVLALHSHHAVDCCKHNRLDDNLGLAAFAFGLPPLPLVWALWNADIR